MADKHTRKGRRLIKFSCEEIYERMDNGMCIFCDELDTPGHHHLKHKGLQIFLVECDDDRASDCEDEAHQPHETLTNPAPIFDVYNDEERAMVNPRAAMADYVAGSKRDLHQEVKKIVQYWKDPITTWRKTVKISNWPAKAVMVNDLHVSIFASSRRNNETFKEFIDVSHVEAFITWFWIRRSDAKSAPTGPRQSHEPLATTPKMLGEEEPVHGKPSPLRDKKFTQHIASSALDDGVPTTSHRLPLRHNATFRLKPEEVFSSDSV